MFLRGYPVAVEDWTGSYYSTLASNWINVAGADTTGVVYRSEWSSGQLGGTSYYNYQYGDGYTVTGSEVRGSQTQHFEGFTTGAEDANGTGTTATEDGSFSFWVHTDTSSDSYHGETVVMKLWDIGSQLNTDDSNITESTYQVITLAHTSNGTFVSDESNSTSGTLNFQPDFNDRGPVWASGTTFVSFFTQEAVTTTGTTGTAEAWTSIKVYYFDGTSYHTDRTILTITTFASNVDSWKSTTYSYNDTSQEETNIYFLDAFGFYVFDSVWIPQYDRFFAEWLWVWTIPDAEELIQEDPYRFTDLFVSLGEGGDFTLECNKDLSSQILPLLDQTSPVFTSTVTINDVAFAIGTGYDASSAGDVTFTDYFAGDFPLTSYTQQWAWYTTLTHDADGIINTISTEGFGSVANERTSTTFTARSAIFIPTIGAMFSYWQHSDGGYSTTWRDVGGFDSGTVVIPSPGQAILTLATNDSNGGAYSIGGLTNVIPDLPNLAQRYFNALGADGTPWDVKSIFQEYRLGYQLPPFVSPEDPIYAGLQAERSMPFPGSVSAFYPDFFTAWTRDIVGGQGLGPQQGPGVFTPYRFFYKDGTDTSGMISAADSNSITYQYSWGTNSNDSNLWELSVTTRFTSLFGTSTQISTGSFLNPITPFGDRRRTFLSVREGGTNALFGLGIFQIGGKHPRAGSNYSNSIFIYGIFQSTNSDGSSGYETFCRSNDNTYFEEDDVSALRNVDSLDCIRITDQGVYSASIYNFALHPLNP